jgi:hypothetical protein
MLRPKASQGFQRSGMPMPCGAALCQLMASSSGEQSEAWVESSHGGPQGVYS